MNIIGFIVIMTLAACSTAEEKQAEVIKDVQYGSGPLMACKAEVYNDLDYAALNQRYPQENVMEASAAQMADNTLPSAGESRLIVKMHNRLLPCRQAFLAKIQGVLPTIAGLYTEEWVANDNINIQLAKQKITWGEAIRQRQETKLQTNAKLREASHNAKMPPPPAMSAQALAAWPENY